MSTPEAFTITRPIPAPSDDWLVTDDRVEALWLPAVGPTSWCLLRLLNAELTDHAEYFARVTLRTSDVAERLFVKNERAFKALTRLRSFRLIDEDPIDSDTYDAPLYLIRRTVRPVGPKEWRKLPASVRERYAELPL